MGSAAVAAALSGGETGSVTGSALADDLLFGPDMSMAGTSIGRTYLGVPRMIPVAGTNRSLGKLLRRDLSILYGDSWWDARIHPWVFCSFDKTMTALWCGRRGAYALPPATAVRYRWRSLMGDPKLTHYHRGSDAPDARFYLRFPSPGEPLAVAQRAHYIRSTEALGFVAGELGFRGAAASGGSALTVALDAICLRAKEASVISARMQEDARGHRVREVVQFVRRDGSMVRRGGGV